MAHNANEDCTVSCQGIAREPSIGEACISCQLSETSSKMNKKNLKKQTKAPAQRAE